MSDISKCMLAVTEQSGRTYMLAKSYATQHEAQEQAVTYARKNPDCTYWVCRVVTLFGLQLSSSVVSLPPEELNMP